jgi:hypothetical protein
MEEREVCFSFKEKTINSGSLQAAVNGNSEHGYNRDDCAFNHDDVDNVSLKDGHLCFEHAHLRHKEGCLLSEDGRLCFEVARLCSKHALILSKDACLSFKGRQHRDDYAFNRYDVGHLLNQKACF